MTARAALIAELFGRARTLRESAGALVERHGFKLRRRGRHMRGACPMCGSGGKSEAFAAQSAGPLWNCHACGRGGDLIALEQLLGGHRSPLEAACALLGEPMPGESEPPKRKALSLPAPARTPEDDATELDTMRIADWLRATSRPARGTIVEAWLTARGLDPAGVPGAITRLRFHPAAPVAGWRVRDADDADRPPPYVPRAPAMLASLERFDGEPRAGVHLTYLAPDGTAKAVLRRRDGSRLPGRKVWGHGGRTGVALTELAGDGPLVVGEGIETVWAVAQRLWERGAPARALAVISLANLQGGAQRDGADALPLYAPQADPERPPTLLRDAGDVVLLVDADMKPIEAKVRLAPKARPVRTAIGALERANLCASLAAQAWRGAGARSVRAIRPPVGQDFNDWIREAM